MTTQEVTLNGRSKSKSSKWNIKKSFHETRQQVGGHVTDPSKKSYATVSKSHQWTNNIKPPKSSFKTEEEWLTHSIDFLLKWLDAFKAQTSSQNKPSTSSASQLCEITLPASASEHTNESRKFNSASAMPSNFQHDTSAAQSDENEMDINSTPKIAIHEVNVEEEPTITLPPKKNCPWFPSQRAKWQKGEEGQACQRSPLYVLTLQDYEDRDRLGGLDLPYDSLMVRNSLLLQNQPIKVNQVMINNRTTKAWLTTTSSSGIVEVLGAIEKTYNCLYQNILLLYGCNKPCLNQIKHKHSNIQHIINTVSTDMVESVFLSKTTPFIAKFNFKLIYRLLQFVLPPTIKHILWLWYMFFPVKLSMNWYLIKWSEVFHLVIWYQEILMAILFMGS